jgi:protoporphyrinogen oxidase
MWGLDPDEISPVQADRRVGASSLFAILQRLLPRGMSSGNREERGVFYYPRNGFGQIPETISAAAQDQGARILLDSPVREVRLGRKGGGQIRIAGKEGDSTVEWDHLWSTLPLRTLVEMIEPSPPGEILGAASALETRAMVLVYLVLDGGRFSEFDAHYFPSEDIPFTRISEPKNYAAREAPAGRTVLCAEIPCSREDPVWHAPEKALAELVTEGLARAGLPLRAPLLRTVARRLPSAYPIYRIGYEDHLSMMDRWLEQVPGVLTFGRQGLFAHDNTHHALAMAKGAVECLGDDGHFDGQLWSRHRKVFATHVVQD